MRRKKKISSSSTQFLEKGKKIFQAVFLIDTYIFKKTRDRLPGGCSPLIAMHKKDRVAARLAAFTPQECVTKHTSVVSTCDSYASLKEQP